MEDLQRSDLDPRIVQTRRLLKEALLELASPDWEWNVSVSQLCKQAAVSRPTFYQHYTGVDKVYSDLLADRLRGLVTDTRAWYEGTATGPHPFERVFVDLRSNSGFYAPVLGEEAAFPASRHQFHRWVMDRLAQTVWGAGFDDLPMERRQRATFVTGGLVFTMTSWAYSRDAYDGESPHDAVVRLREYMSTMVSE